MDCSPPGSSVHGVLQPGILEWVAMPSSRRSSQPRDGTWVSCTVGRFFTVWATWEAQRWYSYWTGRGSVQHLLKFGNFCDKKETYNQCRMRMHYVTGYLGTNFIRILSVKKKVTKKKKKKNQISLRKEKNWVVELGSTKRWASSICCYCCCSITQSHPALCDPMNCSATGFPILHHLPEFAQTYVLWIGDAI